jgi:hypothetical protein
MSQRLSVRAAAFSFQMHWHDAGGDLSLPNHIHQRSDRVSMPSKHHQNASDIRPTSYPAERVVASC